LQCVALAKGNGDGVAFGGRRAMEDFERLFVAALRHVRFRLRQECGGIVGGGERCGEGGEECQGEQQGELIAALRVGRALPPHPRPLSLGGRGEKRVGERATFPQEAVPQSHSPLAPGGRGAGGEGGLLVHARKTE
jgi:hypothetical protein